MTIQHASSCALHNEPAYPAGPCDCGAIPRMVTIDANLINDVVRAAAECAEDLEHEIDARYGSRDGQTRTQERRHNRDLEPVRRVRAAVWKLQGSAQPAAPKP